MSSATDLQNKIQSTIPLSEAMQFEIVELTEKSILVQAPLSPNVNIHGTGFAGSIYSLAVLCGWAMATHIIDLLGIDADLVVSKAEIRYRKPVNGDIECRCEVSESEINQLAGEFENKGRSRLVLDIRVGDSQAMLNATYHISSP